MEHPVGVCAGRDHLTEAENREGGDDELGLRGRRRVDAQMTTEEEVDVPEVKLGNPGVHTVKV